MALPLPRFTALHGLLIWPELADLQCGVLLLIQTEAWDHGLFRVDSRKGLHDRRVRGGSLAGLTALFWAQRPIARLEASGTGFREALKVFPIDADCLSLAANQFDRPGARCSRRGPPTWLWIRSGTAWLALQENHLSPATLPGS